MLSCIVHFFISTDEPCCTRAARPKEGNARVTTPLTRGGGGVKSMSHTLVRVFFSFWF